MADYASAGDFNRVVPKGSVVVSKAPESEPPSESTTLFGNVASNPAGNSIILYCFWAL
jgi:hypothetical protein